MDQNTNLQLMEYRNSIDNIDAALVFLLSERFKITQKVGILKAKKTLPPADKSREAKQVARLRELAQEAGLDPALIEQIFKFIVAKVVQNHEKLRGEKSTT